MYPTYSRAVTNSLRSYDIPYIPLGAMHGRTYSGIITHPVGFFLPEDTIKCGFVGTSSSCLQPRNVLKIKLLFKSILHYLNNRLLVYSNTDSDEFHHIKIRDLLVRMYPGIDKIRTDDPYLCPHTFDTMMRYKIFITS